MSTRREFLQDATQGALAFSALPLARFADASSIGAGEAQAAPPLPPPAVDSDVGSLYPFVQSQAVKGEFPLSFLQPRFTDVPAWKRQARGKLLELLHYAPAPCDPRPEVVERVDRGDYVRETVHFNTTPDLRVPAYVLVPKEPACPRPASSPCTTTAASTSGARRSWSRPSDEHPGPDRLQAAVLRRPTSIATDLARAGYVVVVIDMFYWGERRMLLDDDPADWRERPRRHHRRAGRRVQPARQRRASSSSAGPSTPPASPGRA